MLNSNCKDCKNIIKCNSRYVNATKGDKIYCPDGSVMVVDQNYQKEITPQKYKPKIELKVHYCEACINYGKRTIMKITEIDDETKEQKLKQFGLANLQNYLAKNFYDFVECPVCKWYKFVKR